MLLLSAIPEAAQASRHFDARIATDAWLATVGVAARARSNSYFEGGYWLILWDFLVTAAVMIMLLQTKFSARMRDWAEKMVRWRALQDFFYWIEFTVAAAVLTFPFTVYEDFLREHQYGLSNQTFAAWLNEQLLGFALVVAFGGLLFICLMALVRRWRNLAFVGRGNNDCLCCDLDGDRAGVYCTSVQLLSTSAERHSEESDSQSGTRQWHSRHRCL
jgi:STE24 endopeptidase